MSRASPKYVRLGPSRGRVRVEEPGWLTKQSEPLHRELPGGSQMPASFITCTGLTGRQAVVDPALASSCLDAHPPMVVS